MKALILAAALSVSVFAHAGDYTDMVDQQQYCSNVGALGVTTMHILRSGIDIDEYDHKFALYAKSKGKDDAYIGRALSRSLQVRSIVKERMTNSTTDSEIKTYVWARCMDGEIK